MDIQIAENIRAQRKARAWTQEQLAEALGVTAGAVYKWENRQSLPEIRLLIEMAALFETSVDALLGYGWQSGGMKQAALRIRSYQQGERLEVCRQYAEEALKKYPNSFDVVYQSAEAYFHAMRPAFAERALSLYGDALRLIAQNAYDDVSAALIENRMAMCHCFLGHVDEAIALFQKNNAEGHNNCTIGLILAQCAGREEEALRFLSKALCTLHGTLQSVCMGYAHAYRALGKPERIRDLAHVLRTFGGGLQSSVSYAERTDVKMLTLLAAAHMDRGERAEAASALREAKRLAERFDAAPSNRAGEGRFYHQIESARAYDDTGETAMDVIAGVLRAETDGALSALWEEVCHAQA